MKGIEHFSPDPRYGYSPGNIMTGANRLWKCRITTLQGANLNNAGKIEMARQAMLREVAYVTRGDGFYTDGSFIQHDKHPYNGGYGIYTMEDMAILFFLLKNTAWDVNEVDKQNVFNWIFNSFEPMIVYGGIMEFVKGREISRQGAGKHAKAVHTASGIFRLAQAADKATAEKYYRMIKYWHETSRLNSFLTRMPIDLTELAYAIKDDADFKSRGELVEHRQFPNMDRIVHRRPGWVFGLALHSTRIYNFEAINNENGKAWYTSDGQSSNVVFLKSARVGSHCARSEKFKLNPAHPNPFNPDTKISYILPEPSQVVITIYDMTGRRVRWLLDFQQAGPHSLHWDGADQAGLMLPSGVYLLSLNAGAYRASAKLTLLR